MIRRTVAIGLAAVASGTAWAGPPYVTDDPEPTPTAKWEVYGYGTGTIFPAASQGEGGFDINYGAAPDLQASAVVSLGYQRDGGHAAEVGANDTELGLKYRFLHQSPDSWMPDVALFPKLEVPTAGDRFGSGRVGFSIPVWAEKDFGPWSLFGGGGYTINPGAGNRNYGFGGIALTRAIGKALSLGGEIYRQSPDSEDGRSTTGIGLGASWQIAPHWSLIGSGGPILAHHQAAGDYAFYAALEFHD